MSGHLFVVHGDLTHLACDDWLIPTDQELTLTDAWLPTLQADAVRRGGDGVPRLVVEPPQEFRRGDARVFAVPEEVRTDRRADSPVTTGQPWLLDVGSGDGAVSPGWLVDGVQRWLDATSRRRHTGERARRLAALPLVGTGAGSAAARHDEVLRRLLPALHRHAEHHDVDIALVLNDVRDHAAAQDVRRRLGLGWALDEALVEAAGALAERAAAGRLALFLGAGVSRAAGLPLWDDLVTELLDLVQVAQGERAKVRRLDVQDQAEYVARRLDGGGRALHDWVRRRFAARPHALAHALLAALPVRETVTTNWDPLFEQAAADADRRLPVLPYDAAGEDDGWLLKLHGDARRGGDLVLRREDYLRFGAEQAALAGVVQALLFTRHMLFVGFSLVDDNFVRIANDVTRLVDRHAGRPHEHEGGRRLGTTVALRADPVKQALWPHLDHLVVAEEDLDTGERARRLEMFLDALSAHVDRGQTYLLDDRYAALLGEGETDLAKRLADLALEADRFRECPPWRRVEALLASLGAPRG